MKRRGVLLLEAIAAGVVLGALLVICVQMLSAAVLQRRAAAQRQWANLELSNILEQICARPWADLTAEAVAKEQLSPSASAELPGAELKVEVSIDAKDPSAKHLTAALRWPDRSGQLGSPVTLSTWKYKITD